MHTYICVYEYIHIFTYTYMLYTCACTDVLHFLVLLIVDLKSIPGNAYEKCLQQFYLFSLLCFPRSDDDDDDDKNKKHAF